MSSWRNMELGKAIQFNPPERIAKGEIAKKIAMEKLTPFEKKIRGFEMAEYSAGPKFRNGDTLVAKITPCLENGKTAQVDILDDGEVAFGSSEFIVLRNNGNSILDYIFYLAKSPAFRKKAISCMEGTSGRKRVNEGALKLQVLPIPDTKTQQKIASVLSSFDSKIELNNRINRELEQMAKLLYDYWFVQFDFPNLEGKPYKTSGGKMVWNGELKREIPEGWKVVKMADWIETNKSGDWGKEEPEGNFTQKVTCIRGADINGLNGLAELKPPVRYILEKNSSKFLKSHDLIIEISGGSPTQSTGRIAFITDATIKRFENPLICSNFCKPISIKNKKLLYNFVYYWNSLYDNGIFFGYEGKTSGIKNLLLDSFVSSYYTVVPNDKIVDQFYAIMESIQEKKQTALAENQQLASLRDWLLPMLMNGQVTVGAGVNSSDDMKSSDELAAKAVYEPEEKLGMVAEPVLDYKKDIAKLTKQEAFLRKLMLASHIVYELCDEPTFGHTKLMKLLYLSEQVGGMALQTNYKKFAAGPFDGKTLTLIDLEYEKNSWFTLEKRSFTIGGQQREATIYKKTEKSLCYKKHFDNYFEQESESIDKLISLFRSEKTKIAEVVATLYFAWKELLAKRTIISETILTKAFYDFHQEKKKFTKEQIMDGYHFMLKHGVYPK